MLLIEERRTGSPRAFTVSVLGHAVAIALLLTVRFAPAIVQARPWRVTLIAPPRALPAPPRLHVTSPPRVFHAPVTRPVETKIALEPPPPLEIHRAPATVIETPRIMLPIVPPVLKTDNLIEPRIAPVQPKLPLRPAGFAAIESVASTREHSRPTSTGSFDSAESTAAVKPRAVAHSSGFSDVAPSPIELAKRAIANASFGDSTVAARVNVSRESTAVALTTPIEIQFKPRPVYSDEARRLHIEGEVQIEIVFEASGAVEIVRVVRGLGHGLDESAIAAARGIRFRPAQRGGHPIDSTAVVHIAFELAY